MTSRQTVDEVLGRERLSAASPSTENARIPQTAGVAQAPELQALERPRGCVNFYRHGGADAPGGLLRARAMGAEQSNSSIVLNDRAVLKVFRRIQPGINPELEMLRFLADHDFANIAALIGWYGYSGELMDATLGVMQRYVAGARDGWELALDALSAPDAGFLDRLGALGAVTGRMHSVLASDSSDPDFAPEEPTLETLSLLSATLDEQIERLWAELPHEDAALAPIADRGESHGLKLEVLGEPPTGSWRLTPGPLLLLLFASSCLHSTPRP